MSVIRIVLHNNLIHFGSPASTTFRSASHPTAVALTEVIPVEEAETAGFGLLLKFAGRPAVGASGLHVGHGPNDLSRVVFERFGTEADVGLARR